MHVFLFTPESKLLVQKRSQAREQFPGALDCSVSEHVKPGESYLEGALRGLREELGFELTTLKKVMKFRMDYSPGDSHISVVYEGKTDTADTGAISVDLEETDRIYFYSLPELEWLMAGGDVCFSRWLQQLVLWYVHKPSEVQVLELYTES